MSSEFLIFVPRELPKQEDMVNKGKEGKMLHEGYTGNHLGQKLSLGVPEFPSIRNFPFSKNMKFCDIPVPNPIATKRHTLDDELDTRLPKLIKLQPEFTNYRSEAAVDMVDAVRSQVIKNDIILGEILENPSVNKNERTDALMEEISLQQLDHGTLDTCHSDRISVEAIGGHSCAAIDDAVCSDSKSSDQQQGFSKIKSKNVVLKTQNGNDGSASLVTGQGSVTGTENLLLNMEKRVIFPHEFVGAEAEEYASIHDSFSLSEFLICPNGFEQKESCDGLLQPVQEEEVHGSSICLPVDVSIGMEKIDECVMPQNEVSRHESSNFALDNKSVDNDVGGSTDQPVCKTLKLAQSAEEGTNSNLLQNNVPDNVMVTLSQTVVKEEVHIKQEVEENPMPQVPSVDLIHNRELDFVDDTVFQNWFMSLVNQETVGESVSTSTYAHRESSDTDNSEELLDETAHKENSASVLAKSSADKKYSVEPHTKNGNGIIDRGLPLDNLTGESGCVQEADHYANRTHNFNEENDTCRFLQNLFRDVADIPPTQKTDPSFEKVNNECENLVPTGLSAPTIPRSAIAPMPTTNLQSLENKSDFATSSESDADNSAKPESDIVHKHHKKELIKKFSSGLLKDTNCDESSLGNGIQNETSVKDSVLPSTSTATKNQDKLVKDCIVISDSDDDSIIEFDIVKTCTKKRSTKSTHSGAVGKNTQPNNRKCVRNTRSSTNEDSLGQQARNSTVKSSVFLGCIVLSDSDDESSKPTLPAKNRASNRSDEGADISDAEPRVSASEINHRSRTGSHGVIDLSGGRSPPAMPKSNAVELSASDNFVDVLTSAFAAADSQCSLADRLDAHNGGLDNHNSNTFTGIVSATITYNHAPSSFGRDSDGGDVIDLSRRNLTPLVASWQNKTNSTLDVLDLSGSDKKQQERHSVIKSVKSATENKSAKKEIAEDKDSSPAWSCPICFESLLSGQSVSSTPCGHVFCTKCIEEAVNQFKKCPTCCRKVALKRVHKIFL